MGLVRETGQEGAGTKWGVTQKEMGRQKVSKTTGDHAGRRASGEGERGGTRKNPYRTRKEEIVA